VLLGAAGAGHLGLVRRRDTAGEAHSVSPARRNLAVAPLRNSDSVVRGHGATYTVYSPSRQDLFLNSRSLSSCLRFV
jgi:hypothetical protein